MRDIFSIQDWRMSMLTEGYEGRFYAPDYLKQKYGKENAKRIEAEIEDMDMNAWDRFTGMESAQEVEYFIADIRDMLSINEAENEMPIGNREVPLGAEAGVADLRSMFPTVDKGEMDNDFFIRLFDALGDYFVDNRKMLTNMDAMSIANHMKMASRAVRGRSSN